MIIFFGALQTLSSDVYQNKLYVKFTADSPLLKEWVDNEEANSIEKFSDILGENSASQFISSSVIKAYKKKKGDLFFSNNLKDITDLERIVVIKYSSHIKPAIAAQKLMSIPYVEYAEPVPVYYFSFVPDDPRIDNQFYLEKINCFDAWDLLEEADTVIVGIVDTGIDYTHEDLQENIFVNHGETGIDKDGNNINENGIDSDGNCFIDDWRGWDFTSSESNDGDNDPMPGHLHGTHVGGTIGAVVNNGIGVAGVCRYVKLLPVKVGSDNPLSVSVSNGYDGILYAATMGAKVINCSWGSYSQSNAEQEVIDAAITLGSVVVAAAGNEGRDSEQYPSSFAGVMSVAAVESNDKRAFFSNYHTSVDVSAPGYEIYAPVPGNWYDYLNGTSMASPIAAGVAALVAQKYPHYTPLQIIEHVKAACDNIYEVNEGFEGLLGKGRVNAYNAVTIENPKSIIMVDHLVNDENDDHAFDAGETVKIDLNFLNVLSPVNDVSIKAKERTSSGIEFIVDQVDIGNMETLQEIDIQNGISFIVPDNISPDFFCTLELTITADDHYETKEFISIILYPSFRTMDGNNITVTFNNRGNIAFNDYPTNLQGDGFLYKDSPNLLFEGALMIATSPERVANVARGSGQSAQNRSFFSDEIFKIQKPGPVAAQEGSVRFRDLVSLDRDVGVSVKEHIYQFDTPKNRDYIICVYDIKNVSPFNYDSLYAGLYFDWDIGPSGRDNQSLFNHELRYGYTKNVSNPELPVTAVQLLSFQKLSYYAIDNDATSAENPGVWDGFTYKEKWYMLSGGIKRPESNVTDASQVIGGGPIKLYSGDSVRVSFAIFAADNEEELEGISKQIYKTAEIFDLANGTINDIPTKDIITELYPNPVTQNELSFSMQIPDETDIRIEIYDISGRRVDEVFTGSAFVPGFYDFSVNVENISQGSYILKISTKSDTFSRTFMIMR